jgi:hypothetical protein
MRRSGKKHKGKEMSVPKSNKMTQILWSERDTGGEEREKGVGSELRE